MRRDKKRKICVVTGTRAEYGLLFWLLKELKEDSGVDLQLVVTGTHLSSKYGMTYRDIIRDGFTINKRINILLEDDSFIGISKSIGKAVSGFARVLRDIKPDIVVLLGDRYEVLGCAQAAMLARVPIAHIHGGEATEGLIDEAIRHSVTKMSYIHFVAAEGYRKRVIQLGEDPKRVFNVGAPGLDYIGRLRLLSKRDLEARINFKLDKTTFLMTYHPVTLREDNAAALNEVFKALNAFPEAKVIITKSNADTDNQKLNRMMEEYAVKNDNRVFITPSLGLLGYLSAMKYCDVVIGNSSSGILEAPAMRKPSVNIGDRQNGRLKSASIIDCPEDAKKIISAVKKALSAKFKASLGKHKLVYEYRNASKAIKNCLKKVDLNESLMKKFYDLGICK